MFSCEKSCFSHEALSIMAAGNLHSYGGSDEATEMIIATERYTMQCGACFKARQGGIGTFLRELSDMTTSTHVGDATAAKGPQRPDKSGRHEDIATTAHIGFQVTDHGS